MTKAHSHKTVFLDTNALVRLFWFWEACTIAGTSLDSVDSWEGLRSSLKTSGIPLIDTFTRRDFEDIESGRKFFGRLNEAKGRCDYFSCQICRSELHHVILTAKATESLIRLRISQSLRSKRPLLIYRTVLGKTDYEQIDEQIAEFFATLLHQFGIDIPNIEEVGTGVSMTTMLEIAKAFWSRILTETMDALIYSAAIESRADYFVTTDTPFLLAINDFRTSKEEWAHVALALRNEFLQLGALKEFEEFSFPEAVKPDHPLS